MLSKHAVLKLGFQLLQSKLGQDMGDPGFGVYSAQMPREAPSYPKSFDDNTRSRTATIQAPKIVNTR